MPWSIRLATMDDVSTIVDFNCRLATETEGLDLDPELILPGVRAGLADPNKALYFVAEKDQSIAGQIMVTFEWSDWRNGWFYWIQSVYVREDCRRQGVFRSLYEHVERLAMNKSDVIGLRLYVDDENASAQETYYNLGMKRSTYFVLEKYPL
ncbi:MAG: GNAT family N-acetyltransferase [Gemmataceae bacterium]